MKQILTKYNKQKLLGTIGLIFTTSFATILITNVLDKKVEYLENLSLMDKVIPPALAQRTTLKYEREEWESNNTWGVPIGFERRNRDNNDISVLADVNGDQLIDVVRIVVYKQNYRNDLQIFASLNNGNKKWISPSGFNTMLLEGYHGTANGVGLSDVNGDGLPDVIVSSYGAHGVILINNGIDWVLE